MISIGILHGPNLNLLGQRQPEIYGHFSLADIDSLLGDEAQKLGVGLESFQSNAEGALVDWVQAGAYDGFVVNAAAYTHTSVALRDAFLACEKPFVEVHISNVFSRETFRHHSYLSDIALGVISGFGPKSYVMGLGALVSTLKDD